MKSLLSNTYVKCVIGAILIATGYSAGYFLHHKKNTSVVNMQQQNIDIKDIMHQQLVDINDNHYVNRDTLLSHKRNLLVFWSPTCRFCKQFFLNHLNSYEVGIFCFPITEDVDYAKFFIEHNEIEYMNLVCIDSSGVSSVKSTAIKAVPTFVILDSEGNIVEQKIGLNKVDSLIDHLYN